MGRLLNAACFIVTGVALIVLGFSTGMSFVLWAFAVALVGYGGYIALSKGSYWVSTFIYLVPIFGIGYIYLKATSAV